MFPDLFRDDVFTLETRRLFLRWPRAKDAAEIVQLAGDKAVAEMTARIPHPYPPHLATAYIADSRSTNEAGSGLTLAIADRRNPDRLIGMIGFVPADDGGSVEIGYWLGRPYWGKGLMTEAAQALVDAVFLFSDLRAIVTGVRVTNPASRAVIEHCGFQFIGSGMSHRAAWKDTVPTDHYRLSRQNWLSLKGWRAPLPVEREALREIA